MTSVIVFTKDRPMQLHAYLESLLCYSDLQRNQIFIIYKQSKEISYEKLMGIYPECNWIIESNFYNDLLAALEKSNDFILFGCDDVVFKNKMSITYAENLLIKNEAIFGYSFRLGTNIKPIPSKVTVVDEHIEWNWSDVSEAHFNYPWELVATLYRKSDILSMINHTDERIVNPNYLESIFANKPNKYVKRPKLACLNGANQVVIITVNRVQDTHLNEVDSTGNTDIYYIDELYNKKNKKLDIRRISQLKNNLMHVGSEYFILEGDSFLKWNPVIHRLKLVYTKVKSLAKNLIKNILFLLKNDLRELAENASKENLMLMLDSLRYEMNVLQGANPRPKIKSADETIKDLINYRASFCRFGDGEFNLINGQSIPFQRYDEKLSGRLKEVFNASSKNIFIGIPRFYFHNEPFLQNVQKYFVHTWASKNRKLIVSMTDEKTQYYDTASTQLYAMYKKFDFDAYFSQIKSIWLDRDIVLVCGNTVFDKLEHNIFSCARSVECIYAPSKDAYAHYDSILTQIKKNEKSKLIIIILGPTATVLAYDLALEGYQALDFGHIAKDYDFYCKKIEHNSDSIGKFYQSD